MTRRFRSLDELPLFASEEEISGAVIGPGKMGHWRAIAPLLEARGFPKIDGLMGGRYTLAVRAFFDREYGLRSEGPYPPHQPAKLGAWHRAVDGPERLGSYQGRSGKRKLKPGDPSK